MKKKFLKHLSLLLTVMFLVSLLVGCAPQEVPPASSSGDSSASASVGSNEVSNLDAQSPIDKTEDAIEYVLSEEDQDNFSDRKYAGNLVRFYPKPGKKLREYTVEDFSELSLEKIVYDQGFLALILKYPGKDQALNAISLLEKRDDAEKATLEYDEEPYFHEIKEDDTFVLEYIVASVQPSARLHTYTPEDFPEVDCVQVTEIPSTYGKRVWIWLREPSRENVIEAVRALEGRADFRSVSPNWLVPVDGN